MMTISRTVVVLFSLFAGVVVGQGEWTSNLYNLLTVTGLREDLPVGTVLGVISVNVPSNLIHPIYSCNSSVFAVGETTGTVTLNAELSYAQTSQFVVTFFANDPLKGYSNSTIVVVNVTPVNHPPMFDIETYDVSVKENVAVGTVVYNTILVTDIDTGPNGTDTISCYAPPGHADAATACQTFAISGVLQSQGQYLGYVTLISPLNYEVQPVYDVLIIAQDEGTPPLSSTATLVVYVESASDNRPIFVNTPIILVVNDSAPASTNLSSIEARDGHTTNPLPLTFSIADDPMNWFYLENATVDPTTQIYSAKIRTNGNINRALLSSNQYSFNIIAAEVVDGKTTQVSSATTVQVIVNAINNFKPTFQFPTYAVNVTQGLGISAVIPGLRMICTDLNVGADSFFELSITSVVPSPVPDIFLLQPTSGQGSVSVALVAYKPEYLDYNNPSTRQYVVQITAQETMTQEKYSGTTTVFINVVSSVGQPPAFTQQIYVVSILDSLPVGSTVTSQIQAIDPNAGTGGRVVYSIISGNNFTSFAIDANSGVVTISKTILYSQIQVFHLIVQATDGTGLLATAILQVQIQNSAISGPHFIENLYVASVNEGSTVLTPPLALVATPLTHDIDVTYSLVADDSNGLFELTTIQASNPQVSIQTTASITMKTSVQYANTPNQLGVYILEVEATTSDIPPLQSNVSVVIYVQNLNNHPPVFNPLVYQTTIKEITPGGTSLLTVNATDLNIGPAAEIHYIISDGSKDNFVIEYSTGVVTVASHADLTIDQFGNQYNITVLGINGASPPQTGTAMIYIHVLDSVFRQPTFNQPSYVYYVQENVTVSTVVGSVTATSPDVRAVLAYSVDPSSITAKVNGKPVTSASGNYDYHMMFGIDPKTGNIIVKEGLSNAYASEIDFQVLANVTDPDVPIAPAVVNVTMYILQPAPNSDIVIFVAPSSGGAPVYVTILNNLPAGTQITQLSAYHVSTQMPVSNYSYGPGSDTQGFTAINPTTGAITLSKSLANEKTPMNLTYIVVARAESPSVASATTTVVVNVQSYNAGQPQFVQSVYNFTIFNNQTIGSNVGTIQATVTQSTSNPTYTISGSGVNDFAIDSTTGEITVEDPDVVDTSLRFVLSATAASGSLSSVPILVYINIRHYYNNYPPVFRGQPYIYYSQDTTLIGTSIGQVNAYDPDPYHTSTITYALVSDDSNGMFSVDPTTGSITTSKLLVASNNSYILNISATSSGVPSQVAYSPVLVAVANVSASGGVPLFVYPDEGSTFYAYEKWPSYPVLTAKGFSTRPLYPNITYSIVGNGNSNFYVDPNTGNVVTIGSLVRDPANPSQDLCIKIDDNGQPNRYNIRCITVTTASDQPPSFTLCPNQNDTLEADVDEQEPRYTPVTTVQACSLQIPSPNQQLHYFITAGNGPNPCYNGTGPFLISEQTGLIITNVTLYWNCTSSITLNVTVSNSSDVGQAKGVDGATIQLVVNVDPVDSNGPSFDSNLPGRCRGIGLAVTEGIMDFSPPLTDVVQMYAGDCDAPQFAGHTFTVGAINFFVSGTLQNGVPNSFAVDPVSGYVRTNLTDYRLYSMGYFIMPITATDSKGRTATSTLTVFIVREGQRLRVVFGNSPSTVNQYVDNFTSMMNSILSQNLDGYSSAVAVGRSLTTHVDKTAFFYPNETDFCFEIVVDTDEVLSVPDGIKLIGVSNYVQLYMNYSAMNPSANPSGTPSGYLSACYVKVTTEWWSGYWFLWWLLIALGLFIFVVGLILCICICCHWPLYRRSYLKSRPYVVLDEPPLSPASDFEWQETVHRMN